MSSQNPDRNTPPPDHYPNQTLSYDDPKLPPGVQALPRDPSQPIHRQPRVFIHRPDEDPHAEAEAYANTSYLQALSTIRPSDFKTFHRRPCVRDAMLPGISAGMGLGALRFVMGASIHKAVGFAIASSGGVALVGYQVCQRRRAYDKEGIRKAVQVLDEKQKMKEREVEQEREREAGRRREEVGGKGGIWGSFKFW